jgi:hypothetical protein
MPNLPALSVFLSALQRLSHERWLARQRGNLSVADLAIQFLEALD